MTTEREMLELAARAAGVRLAAWEGPEECWQPLDADNDDSEWNPLNHAHQCMWLLFKLQMGLEFGIQDCRVMRHDWRSKCLAYCEWHVRTEEHVRHDRIRHAIVRAAAEIGKRLK